MNFHQLPSPPLPLLFGSAASDLGTACLPLHAAPEVRSGGAYRGMPADMWALGVTLYLFVFGEFPFKASGAALSCHRPPLRLGAVLPWRG